MHKLFFILLTIFSLNSLTEFDNKCSVVITLRLQSNGDAYNDALEKIDNCKKYDVLSVTSFLDEQISKVYITDIIQNYCMFNHEIVVLLDKDTSNLSCINRGKRRVERKFN